MKILLFPFAILYGLVVRLRNTLFDIQVLPSISFQLPVISVGNLTAGGTGKTPHVEYLAGLLKDDMRVAVLSRGYRRKTRDFRIVSPGVSSLEVGDEPLQIKEKFPEITVVVDRQRVHGVEELMKLSPKVECVLLDDAFQHRSIKPGCSILLIDYNRPVEKDRLLPAGMLREPVSGRRRAQIILVTKSPEELKPIEMREYVKRQKLEIGQHLFFTTMAYGKPVPLFPESVKDRAGNEENPSGILIFTGIAGKNALEDYAAGITANVQHIRFGDHHRYRQKDLETISNKFLHMRKQSRGEVLVITTEKDAVKIREMKISMELKSVMFAIPLEVKFLNSDKENFDKQILSYVTDNKRSSILHQGADRDNT